MTDQPMQSRWKRRALIPFVLLMPVWYVLSIGPAWWLFDRWNIPIDSVPFAVMAIFYAPLDWIAPHWEWLSRFLSWYETLWT